MSSDAARFWVEAKVAEVNAASTNFESPIDGTAIEHLLKVSLGKAEELLKEIEKAQVRNPTMYIIRAVQRDSGYIARSQDAVGSDANTEEVLRHIEQFNAKGLFPTGGIDEATKGNLVKLPADRVAILLGMAETKAGEVAN